MEAERASQLWFSVSESRNELGFGSFGPFFYITSIKICQFGNELQIKRRNQKLIFQVLLLAFYSRLHLAAELCFSRQVAS